MSDFAGNLPSKFNSYSYLGCESSARFLLKEREAENLQNIPQIDEVSTVVAGKTSNSPAKFMSFLQSAPIVAAAVESREEDEDRDMTIAEKKCVRTSSDEDVEDLSAFVTERLQCLRE